MSFSPTLALQEVDIINWIIEQSEGSESEGKVELLLKRFEGKHFRNLNSEELLDRVKNVSTKLRKRQLLNNFSHWQNEVTPNLRLIFDIKGKTGELEQYTQNLLYEIGKAELQLALKKGNYAWLDEDTKTFYFKLPNGSPKPIVLWTTRAQSDHIFLLFKVLYKHWYKFHEQTINKSTIKTELAKLDWNNATDDDISECLNNLRDTKIKPAELSTYITIFYDRKQKGYKVVIGYP